MEIEVTTKPYAGRYPFVPLEEMSTTEWGWMIDIAGCLPLKVDEALQGGDPRVVTMVAVVALHRAGKVAEADVPQAYKRLAGQPAFTTVDFITDPAEGADADPPPQETGASAELFWAKFEHYFGQPGGRPERLWNPALGYFAVAPREVGDMTPKQLLDCVDVFLSMRGTG